MRLHRNAPTAVKFTYRTTASMNSASLVPVHFARAIARRRTTVVLWLHRGRVAALYCGLLCRVRQHAQREKVDAQ